MCIWYLVERWQMQYIDTSISHKSTPPMLLYSTTIDQSPSFLDQFMLVKPGHSRYSWKEVELDHCHNSAEQWPLSWPPLRNQRTCNLSYLALFLPANVCLLLSNNPYRLFTDCCNCLKPTFLKWFIRGTEEKKSKKTLWLTFFGSDHVKQQTTLPPRSNSGFPWALFVFPVYISKS